MDTFDITNTTNNTKIIFNDKIKEKLDFFIKSKKIPNIIFHGTNGCGKRTIVNNFVYDIYDQDKSLIKTYVMNVNCAHGKGIKFIREELKFFAKTHINNIGTSCYFKTIILSNADKLTIDAQSALRRCIELFSHNTRFFIIVEDKYKLLKPIISRFCVIFITEPMIFTDANANANANPEESAIGKRINLHKYNIQQGFISKNNIIYDKPRELWLTTKINKYLSEINKKKYNYITLIDLSIKLYEKGYSGLDLIQYIEKDTLMNEERKYHILILFQKIKKDFRNEKMFILFILQFLFFRSEKDLENISFM
jgi:DNA polymerase III delta prime subunit